MTTVKKHHRAGLLFGKVVKILYICSGQTELYYQNHIKMKNRYAYAVLSLVLGVCAFMFTSCDDEESSCLPVFSALRVTPDEAFSGNTVKIEAVQAARGRLIYKAAYTWLITLPGSGTNEEIRKTETVVYDQNSKNPVLTFEIPTGTPGGICNVTFQAQYYYSAGKVDAPRGGQGVTVTQNSALYGIMSGSTRFRVFAQPVESSQNVQ